MNFKKREVLCSDCEHIKLARGEYFVAFMKFKRKLFVMTTKRVYEIVETK